MASDSGTPKAVPASPATVSSMADYRSRRDSLNSVSASSQIDREQLAITLDRIHTSASQSDALTTFNDFAPPPGNAPVVETKGTAGEMVQGLSGLYSRFREAVGVGKTAAQEGDDDAQEVACRKSSNTGKASASSFARGESGATNSSFNSGVSEVPTSTASTFGNATAESHSQIPQSSRASSVTTMTASKTTTSSSQNPLKIAKASAPTAANPAVAPVTVSAFPSARESSRGLTSRVEESQSRSSRKSSRPPGGSPRLDLSTTVSLDSVSISERIPTPILARREDGFSIDGSTDGPTSPIKPCNDNRPPSSASRMTSAEMKKPFVIDRISYSRNSNRSRSSSMEPGVAAPSTISTSAHNSVNHDSFAHHERPQRLDSGILRIPGTTTNQGAPEMVNARLESMRKQVLSKEFWMADDTCKECWLCGTQFSAFRRKHHCRTCGCIFDSKCTSIISGQKFGVQGSLRVCKTCLEIINRRYDSGSDDSEDESFVANMFRPTRAKATTAVPQVKSDDDMTVAERSEQIDNTRTAATPMMAIPATRRVGGDSNRHSAILEIDMPSLSRPSSSRSLKSLATGRPQSGHRRHHSKHNLLGRFKSRVEDRAPFRSSATEELARKSKLPAFHDDNIIDPDLAPYMSDESSGDEQMSIFTAMGGDVQPSSLDPDRPSFGPFINSGRKHRLRQGEKSVSALSFTSRGYEEPSAHPNLALHSRPSRRRNLSTASASVHHLRSPRPKSGIFKNPSMSTEALLQFEYPGAAEGTKLRRSDSVREAEIPQPLDPASLAHVKRLFRQLLSDSRVSSHTAWEKALIPVLSRCTDDVDLDVRSGDDMDIRHFVKLKKIPGGRASDTAYVQGIVFTKNLALKSMPRKLFNEPKIVLVSFAIEYQRHPEQHFMSLQPVIEQEKEYLRKVVNRIIALRPQVLLVQRSVAGVALQMLSEANIAVAYNVKASVIEAVSRIADTDIISSLDMLALPIRVGVSKSFEVKTFVNSETKGQKKTYIFITGTNPKLGCTIALRGASSEVLSQMKRITEFMVYVVYNVKLELCLMRDAYVQIDGGVSGSPSRPTMIIRESTSSGSGGVNSTISASHSEAEGERASQPDVELPTKGNPDQGQHRTAEAADPEQTKKPVTMHQSHSHLSQDSQLPEDIPMPTYYSDMVAKYETRVMSVSPLVRFTQPYLLMRAREQERRVVYLKRLRDQDIVEEQEENEKSEPRPFQLIKPEMVHEIGQKAPRQIMEVLHAVHDAEYDKALHNYQTQTRAWENNIQDSLDLFDPLHHQNIVVLYSMVCTSTKIPCVEPGLVTFEFYNQYADEHVDSDCTLGQFIEELCQGADSICAVNNCCAPLYHHHRTYVHDQARITIFVEHGTPIPDAFQATKHEADKEDGIIMWSYCKSCKTDFGGLRMSPSTWKYSFGKFLELSFLGRGMALHKDSGCLHDHPRDHLRYFAFHNNIVRMHHDPIDLYEVIVPRARITWKVENDLKLKNEIFTKAEQRWNRFMDSVKTRIKSIKIDTSVLPEKAEGCKIELDKLSKKVQEDQPRLVQGLQEAYMNSKYYEVIPLNAVVREMLREAAEWDAAFAKFETEYLSDKDVRQLAIIQLKKFFTDNESRESLPASDGASLVSDSVEEKTPLTTQTDASEGDEKVTSHPLRSIEDQSEAPATDIAEASLDGSNEALGETRGEGDGEIQIAQEDTVADPAVEILERVEPLDLATPPSPVLAKTFPVPRGPMSRVPTESSERATRTEPVLPPVTAALPEINPPDVAAPSKDELTLSEKVEKLRREQHRAASHDLSNPGTSGESDSVRPVPERIPSRRAGLNVSPPIMRALSQPAGALPRTASSIGKLLKDSKSSETSEILVRVGATDSIKSDKKFSDRIGLGALKNRKSAASGIPRYVHGSTKKRESKVSTLARHFEQLSREFEKERIRDRKQRAATIQSSRAFLPRTSTKAIVEVYEDVDQAVQEPGPSEEDPVSEGKQSGPKPEEVKEAAAAVPDEPADKIAETNETPQPEPLAETSSISEQVPETGMDPENRQESQVGSDDEGGTSDADHSSLTFEEVLSDVKEIAEHLEPSGEITEELPKHQKKSVMNLLTNFWAERSASNWPPLEYPLNATDHIFLDSDVIIREDEPSSVIAFALSSNDYQGRLREIRQQWNVMPEDGVRVDDSDSGLEMKSSKRAGATPGVINEKELEKSLKRPTTTHLKYQFFDRSAKMLCKVFYAEQFDALRQKCGVADRIIESLSRCLKWDSKGGKTKSVFLKTLDDRIVMKSLSPIETAAFLRFAPAYFSIMAEALFYDLPSVIAKMLGFFQVVIKNPDTNTEIKLDLLVMENLFYDRSPSRTFDLKGSMRNRKIQSTGEQNEVLLDENMVEYIYESPLFAREHSKRLLRASVWNDTLFLARQNVMDYSLMIAVDESKKELVVGIIDCIRTYTWDKRLESWIKDRGFAGGGRNKPTVTSPKEYKSRFREAMARYILQSPNCWHPFGKAHASTIAPGTPRTRFEGDA